jgi:DNA polymerase III alpha subunit
MKQYANYHKHDIISNIFVPDTHVKCESYLKRIKELGYDCYWTTNHGSGGDIFEARDLCDKYGIKCFFGVEGYIVPNPLDKDNRNYHIIIIPKTNEARKKVNYITSHASEEGFYYKPRIFLEDLLKLNKEDIYLTSACVAGLMHDEDSIELLLKPLVEHFGQNFFLEVQNHQDEFQKEINRKCLQFSKQYGLKLIAANDSHYIYPEDSKDRLEFLKGKGINYGDEDTYVLDYPDYDTMFSRFQKQGILTDKEIEEAIDNTRIFETCEEIYLDKEIKMPSAYLNLNPDEKIKELKKHINKKFAEIREEEHIEGEQLKKYIEGIRQEMQTIIDTKEINTADYFLLNEKIVDLAVHKYNGVLTRTGRGSCGGFYINRILGMTQIDRFTSPIKLYPERFISTARLLENRAMPDIDYNVASQEPFVLASREVLGEHSVYPMIAYGTMQIGEAFRNVCRSHGLEFDEFNDVAKDVDNYSEDPKWKPYIEEAKKYVDVVVSASVHPCAHAMDNKDLRYEYGIVKIGNALCVMITSGEADYWKILKDDFLIVSIWGIIADTFKLIGKPIITVNQLLNDLDDRVWDLYANGITCTLNQVDSDYATSLMKKYKVRSVGELAQFTAAVRPSFDAWRDAFIYRKPFTTGSKYLDDVLSETRGMITFQETLMTYFQWLGITPAESIGLIKKISKKKIHPEDFKNLEDRLKEQWIKNTGSIDKFDDTWKMVQGCMSYGFAAPHALATAIDSLYGAWLKVHYPLEYYSVVFKYYEGDMERTNKLTEELKYFNISLKNIQFGRSAGSYKINKEENSIYKGLGSIKYCNAEVGDKLYELSQTKQYNSFMEILKDFPGDSRQLDILIKLGYFSDFGSIGKLLKIVDIYNQYGSKTIIKKDQCAIDKDIMLQYATETEKQYRLKDKDGFINYLLGDITYKEYPITQRIKDEKEYLGYVSLKIEGKSSTWYVTDINTKYSPKVSLYNVGTGEEKVVKIEKRKYQMAPFDKDVCLRATFEMKNKCKKDENGDWVKLEEKEEWIKYYSVV